MTDAADIHQQLASDLTAIEQKGYAIVAIDYALKRANVSMIPQEMSKRAKFLREQKMKSQAEYNEKIQDFSQQYSQEPNIELYISAYFCQAVSDVSEIKVSPTKTPADFPTAAMSENKWWTTLGKRYERVQGWSSQNLNIIQRRYAAVQLVLDLQTRMQKILDPQNCQSKLMSDKITAIVNDLIAEIESLNLELDDAETQLRPQDKRFEFQKIKLKELRSVQSTLEIHVDEFVNLQTSYSEIVAMISKDQPHSSPSAPLEPEPERPRRSKTALPESQPEPKPAEVQPEPGGPRRSNPSFPSPPTTLPQRFRPLPETGPQPGTRTQPETEEPKGVLLEPEPENQTDDQAQKKFLLFELDCTEIYGFSKPTFRLLGVVPEPAAPFKRAYNLLQRFASSDEVLMSYRGSPARGSKLTHTLCQLAVDSPDPDLVQSVRQLFVHSCVQTKKAFAWEESSFKFEFQRIPGDGKCMFTSFFELLAQALEMGVWYPRKEEDPRFEEIMNFRIQYFETGEYPCDILRDKAINLYAKKATREGPDMFEQFVREEKKKDKWGDGTQLQALCDYYDFVVVFTDRRGAPVFKNYAQTAMNDLIALSKGRDSNLQGQRQSLEAWRFGWNYDKTIAENVSDLQEYPQKLGYMICGRAEENELINMSFEPNSYSNCYHFDIFSRTRKRAAMPQPGLQKPYPDLCLLSEIPISGSNTF